VVITALSQADGLFHQTTLLAEDASQEVMSKITEDLDL